jgi:hypothetical protein
MTRHWTTALAAAALVWGCGAKQEQSGPAWNEPEPEYEDHYEPMDEPVVLEPVAAPPAGQVGEIEPEWLECEKDADCTTVETECCGYVAVHRDHWNDARAVLPYSTCDMLCPTNIRTACVEGICEVEQ